MLPKFERMAPVSVEEAIRLYHGLADRARVYAGGTDLLVQLREGRIKLEFLIDIKGVKELRGLDYSPQSGLVIGALTTHNELQCSPVVSGAYPCLVDGVSRVGSRQIRQIATIGGNICNAVPSADSIPPLLVLGARLVLQGTEGERQVALEDFFLGPGQTILGRGEILTQIKLPAPVPASGAAYYKFTRRRAMDLALLGVAVYLEREAGTNVCSRARIALATAAPTPLRASQAEQFLAGRELTPEVFKEAGRLASQEARPRSSFRSSEGYRRDLLQALVPRAAMSALSRIPLRSEQV